MRRAVLMRPTSLPLVATTISLYCRINSSRTSARTTTTTAATESSASTTTTSFLIPPTKRYSNRISHSSKAAASIRASSYCHLHATTMMSQHGKHMSQASTTTTTTTPTTKAFGAAGNNNDEGPTSAAQPTTTTITTVFFDLDNTLIPTRKADTKACNRMADVLQRAPHHFAAPLAVATCDHFLRTFRACPDNPAVPLDAWRRGLWSDALPAAERHRADVLYAQWLELRFRYLALTPATVAFLQRLRADGYRLALITNGPSAAQWEKVRRLNVARLFECVLVSGDQRWEKPDRRIFELACRTMGVQCGECVMVGDKLNSDIQGGIEANLGGTIWTPLSVDETLAARNIQPSYIVHHVLDIGQLLPPLHKGGVATRRGSIGSSSRSSTKAAHHHHQHLRVASLPDLDSGNSNSSDGS